MTEQVPEYDVIVVGAGMAGIVLAARVAERGINPRTGDRLRVALIEAGPHWLKGRPNPGFGDPANRRMIPQISWEEFVPLQSWPWPLGLKVVGGCSLQWGARTFMPFDVDYENWCATGINWTKENMKGAVDDVRQMFHIRTDPPEAATQSQIIFKEAAHSLGYKAEPRSRAGRNKLYSAFKNPCKYDTKASSLWYLPIAEENGVELIDRAEVNKVIIEKQGAGAIVKGIAYERDGHAQMLNAGKVVVSCGYAGTPLLLARSGYGPRQQLGTKLIAENSNVGSNLDDDKIWTVPIRFKEAVQAPGRLSGGGAGYEVMVDDSAHKDGTGTLLIGEISSLEEPHARALSEFAPAFGKAHMDYMREDSSLTRRGAIQLIATRAPAEVKGKVDLKTGAKIYPDVPYLNKRMQVAREMTMEIANKMGAEVAPQFPKSFRGIGGIGGIGHVCGTCCAGKDRRISVINEDFESHDVKGLFVVDASSYPRGAIFSGAICAIMGSFGAERIVKNYFSRGAGR